MHKFSLQKRNFRIFKQSITTCLCFFLMPFLCIANNANQFDISYKIKYSDQPLKNCLNVSGEIKGNEEKKVLIKVPSSGTDLEVFAPSGINIQYLESSSYQLSTRLPENIQYRYKVCSNNPKRDVNKAIIEPKLFHLIVSQSLIILEDDPNKVKKIKLDLSEMPDAFNLISSFSLQKRTHILNASMQDFYNSVIAGGTKKIQTLYVKDKPIYLLAEGEWPIFQNKLSYYLETLITHQRTFWNDFDFPDYVIFFKEQNVPEDERFLVGIHKNNFLSLTIPNNNIPEKLPKILYMISHELNHAWLGDKIRHPHPQGSLQWLFEGVDDYYGLRFALGSGVISYKEYISLLNTFIKNYFSSPFNNISNSEIANNFKRNSPHGFLAQIRSHLTFLIYNQPTFNKDKKISSETPLDLAMREVIAKFNKGAKEELNDNTIDKIFVKHFGIETWTHIKQHLIAGKNLHFPPTLLTKDTILVNKRMELASLGFDANSLITRHKIAKIAHSSNAYKAGLREGQSVVEYSQWFADPTVSVQIGVKTEKDVHIISFKPNTIIKSIPQYSLLN